MNKKHPWLPIDERLVPDIFSFSYPKSTWVRVVLAVEMICAVLAVIGTLFLMLFPRPLASNSSNTKTQVTTSPR